jgi:hypothetical protein
MRELPDFNVESMTDEQFLMLEDLLGSLHDFLHQVLRVLFILQPPHTNNDLIKALRPNGRLAKAELAQWRLDTDHGLLHGLITAFFATKLAGEWTLPEIRENVDLQRLIASCVVHDYAKVATRREPHDQELRRYFSELLPESYSHSQPAHPVPLVQADRTERLRYPSEPWTASREVLQSMPHENAAFQVWAFYKLVRPALARIFHGRNELWLRHGAEEADWRTGWPTEAMVSRSKDFWPNFYYPWPGRPEYWAIEVGELRASFNKPHLVDFYFPAGLMTIEEYRASEEHSSIVSAAGREHELATGRIPLPRWIFVFQDHQLMKDRYLVTGSGGIVTLQILTNILDVADALYSKLYAIG